MRSQSPARRVRLAATVAALGLSSAGQAGSLTYQPVNPSFGGSPLNGPWLLQQGQAQNEFERKEKKKSQLLSPSGRGELTPGQQFARQLQGQLYGSLANKITEAIFGENAQRVAPSASAAPRCRSAASAATSS